MPANVDLIHRRYKKAHAEKANWLSYWEDLARFGAPRRMGFVGQRTPGDKRVTPQVYNPIGINCVQTLAAALHGMTMNPAIKWLNLRLVDDDFNEREDVKHWCNSVSKRVANILASPQVAFHSHANQLLEDLSSIGTGVMYCGQQTKGPNANHLFVRTHSIAKVCIAENQYGAIDTVMLEYEYSVRQMVNIWGNSVSAKVREKYDKSQYDDTVKVINCVSPREQYDPQIKTPLHHPIEVVYFQDEEQHLLEETGVEEMPYVVPRWWLATGEVFGRSPFMTALPQVKVANIATKTIMDAAEKAVAPPLTVPHEGLIGPVRTSPNGITFLKGKAEIGQIPTSSQLPYAGEYIRQLDDAIRTTMFVDQVQFIGDFKMTATEVIQRQTERMRLLGPVLGRLENEFLNPLITRVFGIMYRLGQIPPAPKDVQGQDLRIEYQSPLARAQKSQVAQGLMQALQLLLPLAQMGPQVAQQIFGPVDMGKLTPMVFDWFGVDIDLLKDERDLAAEAQQQRTTTMMQMLPTLASAAKDAGMAVDHLSKGASNAADTTATLNDAANNPSPGMAAMMQQGGAPPAPGQPGGPGGQNIAELIGALTKGGAAAAPQAAGGPADFLRAFQGRLQ